jgi:ATP/maltotriose-dependent transcriptional regulator MalT/DNA-binding SARP family transcriptional activator
MPPRQPLALAKLKRPKLFGVIERARLFALLDQRRTQPVVWISGPPGAGKTTLVATYLEARKLPGIWYQVDSGDADPASFFYYLGQAAQDMTASERARLPLLTPEYLADLPGFTRRFFRELFGRMPASAALVLDNYQDVAAESALHAVVCAAFEEARHGITIVIVSRGVPPAQCARALANNVIGQLGWQELQLTLDETTAIANARQPLDVDTLRALQEQSDGWAAGLVLMVERLKQTGSVKHVHRAETMDTVFNYFAGQVFDQAEAPTQALLLRTAFLPSISVQAAEKLTGNSAADKLLEQLYRRHLFTDRRVGEVMRYQYHALFRGFLVSRAREVFNSDELRELKQQSANLLEEAGNADDALLLHVENADWPAATAGILKQARSLIAQGRWLTLRTWIEMLPKSHVAATPWLMLFQGSSLILIDPPKARRMLAEVFERFLATHDELGQLLAATGTVESFNIEFATFSELDPWIAVLEDLLQREIVYPSQAIKIRADAAMMLATTLRQPGHPLLLGCATRVMAMLDADLSATSKADMATQLLQHYDFCGDLDGAGRVVAKATPLLNSPELSPIRRAGWLVFFSYHSALVGAYREGFEALDRARDIATTYGLSWFAFFDLFFRSLLHLMGSEPLAAEPLLDKLNLVVQPTRPADAAQYHLARSMFCQARADVALALHHGQLCIDAAKQTGGAIFTILFPAVVASAFIEAGELTQARALLADARALSAGTAYRDYEALFLMVDAYASLRGDDLPESHRQLTKALRLGRHASSAYFFRWMVVGFRLMLIEALRVGIETEYVVSLIKKFDIRAQTPEIEHWPWPVKIYALGRFSLVIQGTPLHFERKAQKKPLEMLKYLVAQGGREVSARAIDRALWPDAEGDAAESSFEVTLRRLRKLLGTDAALELRDGKLSLDPHTCWLDTWAFERIHARSETLLHAGDARAFEALAEQAVALYAGHFLPEDDEQPWLLGCRQRLASKLLRHVEALGQTLEQNAEQERAASLYRRVIELDALAEPAYRRLMILQGVQGRKAEALETYRRCRQMLSAVLGVQPSAETESAHRSLLKN